MAEDNEMPVMKNVLGGPVHIFKTEEQMDAMRIAKEQKEIKDATEEISN